MRYRLHAALTALAARDHHQAAITIAAGRTIDVIGKAEDERFCIIRVDGEELLAFESDIHERGTLLKEQPVLQRAKLKRASGQ